MRQEVIDKIKSLGLAGYNVSSEVPYDDGGNTLYVKNPKTIYIDNVQTIAEPIESPSTVIGDERNEIDLTDLEIIEEQQIDEVNVEEKQYNSLKEQEDIITTYQTALQSIQKIRIPIIYIPKINITIPKVYRIKKKRE